MTTLLPNEVRSLQITSLLSTTTVPPNDGVAWSLVQCWALCVGCPATAWAEGKFPTSVSVPPSKNAAVSQSRGSVSINQCLRSTLSIQELPIMVNALTMTFAIYASCGGRMRRSHIPIMTTTENATTDKSQLLRVIRVSPSCEYCTMTNKMSIPL